MSQNVSVARAAQETPDSPGLVAVVDGQRASIYFVLTSADCTDMILRGKHLVVL